jgi:hypothetical protein
MPDGSQEDAFLTDPMRVRLPERLRFMISFLGVRMEEAITSLQEV